MSVGKVIRPALPANNVGASLTASGNITPGRTIEAIIFKCGGTTFDVQTHISNVKVKINGKTVIEGTGAELSALSEFRGETHSDVYLHLDLTESLKGRDYLDEMAGAWDTSAGVANITYEVSIGAATAPTLTVYTVESAPQRLSKTLPPEIIGLMHKTLKYPFSVAAAGNQSIPLPFGPVNGSIIKRIHIEHANVIGAQVKQDGNVVHESLAADNQFVNTANRNTNQSGFYSIDFTLDGNMKNALDSRDARSLELIGTFSGAAAGNVLVEYLDYLGNL